MACDIHAYIEVKIAGRWVCHSQPKMPRSYDLFSKIAGIRGGHDPIVPPRGFPADASEITRIEYEYDGNDAHTPGWLTGAEMRAIDEWYAGEGPRYVPVFGYVTGNPPWGVPEEEGYPAAYQEARLVFWFDN